MFLALGLLWWMIASSSPANESAQKVADFHRELDKRSVTEPFASAAQEKAALDRFTSFLQGIGDREFIKRETLNVYSSDAFLDDTLVVHHGAAAIEEYFTKTANAMTSCKVTIDDIAESGPNYYVRWTMVFAAPALSAGQAVHSIGISQVRFDRDGKVSFHQDYWDAGQNFFGHLPVAKGVLGFIRKRLQ